MTGQQFWIYMFTILLAPLVAIQVSEVLQKRKEARARRVGLFKTLMATRASRLSGDHVQALNMIDIEFHGSDRRSKQVVEAWKAYLNHLNTQIAPEMWSSKGEVWISKGDDLFVELLHAMARSLGYSMDKTDVRSTSYFPTGYGRIENEQARVRTGLLALLEGGRALTVELKRNRPPSGSQGGG